MTTPTQTRTVTLTDSAPVQIVDAEWPQIAAYTEHGPDGAFDLRVRQHADGRALVYGITKPRRQELSGGLFVLTGVARRGGAVLPLGNDIPAAVRRVGTDCCMPDSVVQNCLACLPPVRI